MWGSKDREIGRLKRLAETRRGERDEARELAAIHQGNLVRMAQARSGQHDENVQLRKEVDSLGRMLTREVTQAAEDVAAAEAAAARYRLAWQSARRRARLGEPVRDELWSLLDWSLWGSGMGDVLREGLADTMTAAITPRQRTNALRIMKWWTEDRGRKPIGRWAYEEEKRRIKRLARACARYRTELAKAGEPSC